MIHQGIHNLPLTQKQVQYNSSAIISFKEKTVTQLIQSLQIVPLQMLMTIKKLAF